MRTKPFIATLKERRQKLDAQIKSWEARDKVNQRKRDTRCKILLGAYFYEKLSNEEIKKHMDEFLTRNSDRKLFDLPEKPEKKEEQKQE